MNKIINVFLLTLLAGNNLECMKRKMDVVTYYPQKKSRLDQEAAIPFLFPELQRTIFIEHLAWISSQSCLRATCRMVNALAGVDKRWNLYINDSFNIRTIINIINNHTPLPTDQSIIALQIATPSSKNYIQQCATLHHKVLKKSLPRIPFSIEELINRGADINFYPLKAIVFDAVHMKNDSTKEQWIKEVATDQPKNLQDNIIMPLLPFELQHEIFIANLPFLSANSYLKTVCTIINTLSLVSKQWNECVSDPANIRAIITTIKKHYPSFSNKFIIAALIDTLGTKNYIQQVCTLHHKIAGLSPQIPFTIQELVDKGADVDFDHLDERFVHLSLTRSSIYTKELLDLGADPNVRDYLNNTPIEVAIKGKDLPMIKLLLGYNLHDKGLLAAVNEGDLTIMDFFLSEVELTKEELNQAYHVAFKKNQNNQAAQRLIEHCLSSMAKIPR